MVKADRRELEDMLTKLFEAERVVRHLHDTIITTDRALLLDAVAHSMKVAARQEEDEASLRLARLAALLGELHGDRVVDLLIDILGCDHAEARFGAGQELTELAFDRFKEVALGVERALKRLPSGSPALEELPYLLIQVPEPGVAKLLRLFLKHPDPNAVASAIEASVELGDPTMAADVGALKDDPREVEMDDDSGESARVTIGLLAGEACEVLADREVPS